MPPMLNIAIRAARAAGNVILRNMDRLDRLNVVKKQRNDYVSDVDHAAEQSIVEVLLKAYPDHAILGEESGQGGALESDYLWIIDPLDGTTNYLHGLPHFSVSIALQVKGRLEQGVVYNPVSQELFTASRGEGATLNSKRIRASGVSNLENALLCTGFPYREGSNVDRHIGALTSLTIASGGIRRTGSAALDLAFVAAGRLDGFWQSGLKPWDCAAGGLLVREAGGLIKDLSGDDQWLDSGDVVATSPKLMHAMLNVLTPHYTSDD